MILEIYSGRSGWTDTIGYRPLDLIAGNKEKL